VSGAWWNTKATRPERPIAPKAGPAANVKINLDYDLGKRTSQEIKEMLNVLMPWTYEILFTIDAKKFTKLRVYPTTAQLVNKINTFFDNNEDIVRIYAVHEIPKPGSSNLHCHALVCFDAKNHRKCRENFNVFIKKYEDRFGMTFSARINKFNERYKPTDKRGTKRYEGSLDSYLKYMKKTEANHNLIDKSVFIARFNNLL